MIDSIAALGPTSRGVLPDAPAVANGSAGAEVFADLLERAGATADASGGANPACTCGKGCASGFVVMDDASYFGAGAANQASSVTVTPDGVGVGRASAALAPLEPLTAAALRSFAATARVRTVDWVLDAAG
jgi:hypothetical protein